MKNETDLRSLVHSFLERIANFSLGSQFGGFLDERVVDFGVYEGPGTGTAALAHVGEDGVVSDLHGLIH